MSASAVILDQFGRPVEREAPKAPSLQQVFARFDLAQTTAHNRRHWAFADGLSARAAMSPSVRSIVRRRSRYEADNNSWYSGILRTASNHIVGCGPRCQVLTNNREGNARIERALARWFRQIQLTEKLRLIVQTDWRDGEIFAMRTARPRNWPISLDIRLYESEQCAAPWIGNTIGDPYIDDGIRIDPNSNEIEYYFYDHHPGDVAFVPTLSGKWYPSSDVIHVFRRERPGQVRGIPRATSALNTLPVMRRQEMATLLASETAASFATYLKSSSSALEAVPSAEAFQEMEIAFNMLSTLPAGWDIAQVDPKHPGPQYEMFQRQALMSFSRCTNMPYALAAGTSKDSNFSSLKGDIKNVWEPEVRSEQNRLELSVMETLFRWFLEEAVYVPGLLDGMPSIDEIEHQWYWPPLPNLDEVESAQAAKLRLSAGLSTPSKEHAVQGTDFETIVGQMARDYGSSPEEMRKRLLAINLAVDPATMATTQPAGGSPSPSGPYTELGQRAWNNNQNRIRRILDALVSGDMTQGWARIELQNIGLDEKAVQAYLDDAADGIVDSPSLQPAGGAT